MIASTIHLDSKLDLIENLTWRPWIGENYENATFKILIIGESHYLARSSDKGSLEESIEKHSNKDFTRWVISDVANDRFSNKIYKVLNKVFNLQSTQEIAEFYNNIAFYNFVQTPVSNIKLRPTDFIAGWDVFKNITELLKPDLCLFVGTKACKVLKDNREKIDLKINRVQFVPKIDNTYPCFVDINQKSEILNCVAIKHSSRIFHPKDWTDFLTNSFPEIQQYIVPVN